MCHECACPKLFCLWQNTHLWFYIAWDFVPVCVCVCVYVAPAHKACVWSQRCVGLRGLQRISHPAVKQPLKCSLVALQGAASHGHILMSAAATWLCLRGAPKARTVTVTDTEWYRAAEQREERVREGKEGMKRKRENGRRVGGERQESAWVIIHMYYFTVSWRIKKT